MKKSILLLLPVLVLSGCNSSDKTKTVVEYLKAPQAMMADLGHCRANPAEENTIKCHNAGRAYGMAINSFSAFSKCTKIKRMDDSSLNITSDKACVDRVAKARHMAP